MKKADFSSNLLRSDAWAAWQQQLHNQREIDLADLKRREHELFPCFSDYYQRLQALPRRWRRGIGRRLHRSLAGVALLLALGQGAAFAATIDVDGTTCTLADAITAANTDTATGGCAAGSGADTLVLPAKSTTTLTAVDNDTYGPNGLPVISSEITIEGNGSTIERRTDVSTPEFRILAVNASGDLTLRESKITGGSLGNSNTGGGGIYNYQGKVTLYRTRVLGNTANPGSSNSLSGGGMSTSCGTVEIIESNFSGNTAYGSGGIWSRNSAITISDSTISGNMATGDAGALGVFRGTVEIKDSTLSDNKALEDDGGAMTVSGGATATIESTTISNNLAAGEGGAIKVGATMLISNSTIADNSTNFQGGGIWNSGSLTISRSLVTGNTAPLGLEVYNYYDEPIRAGVITANDHNLLGDSSKTSAEAFAGFTPGPTDITATSDGTNPTALNDILDTKLRNNGGPTDTLALVTGSPAIDAVGANCPPPDADQRSRVRPVDGDGDGSAACDIGAFEFYPIVNDLVSLDGVDTVFDTHDSRAPAGVFTISATFTNTSATPIQFPFFQVTELSSGTVIDFEDLNSEDDISAYVSELYGSQVEVTGAQLVQNSRFPVSVGDKLISNIGPGDEPPIEMHFTQDPIEFLQLESWIFELSFIGDPLEPDFNLEAYDQLGQQVNISTLGDINVLYARDVRDGSSHPETMSWEIVDNEWLLLTDWQRAIVESPTFRFERPVSKLKFHDDRTNSIGVDDIILSPSQTVLLNADGRPGGVGSTLTADVSADQALSPGESVTTEFEIRLQTEDRFRFFVNFLGEPVQ